MFAAKASSKGPEVKTGPEYDALAQEQANLGYICQGMKNDNKFSLWNADGMPRFGLAWNNSPIKTWAEQSKDVVNNVVWGDKANIPEEYRSNLALTLRFNSTDALLAFATSPCRIAIYSTYWSEKNWPSVEGRWVNVFEVDQQVMDSLLESAASYFAK